MPHPRCPPVPRSTQAVRFLDFFSKFTRLNFAAEHFHIFVGDLSPEVDNPALQEAFKAFGDVSEAKVIRDPATLKSKGYGFVAFVKKEEAERAIDQMNGAWLGRRAIRTNWASRRGQAQKQQSYDEVYNQTAANNNTVYLGNIGQTVTEEDIRGPFGKYGNIVEVSDDAVLMRRTDCSLFRCASSNSKATRSFATRPRTRRVSRLST